MHEHDQCACCGSSHLLRVATTPSDHSRIVVGDRLLHTVAVAKYVCTDCGRLEEWVNGKEDLRRLKEALLSDGTAT